MAVKFRLSDEEKEWANNYLSDTKEIREEGKKLAEEDRKNANAKFNKLVEKKGEYESTGTTKSGTLLKSYKKTFGRNSDNYKSLKQSIKETEKNNLLPKASETNSLPTASNKEYLSRNANIPTLSLDNVTKSKIGIKNNVNSNENKNNILNNSQVKNNYYLSDLPTANSLSKYKLKKEENTEETVKNIDELSPAELEAYNIPITSNNDPRLSLMKKRAWEYDTEDYKNLAELNKLASQKQAEAINNTINSAKYTLKQAGVGAVGGITGMVEAGITETANNLKEGENNNVLTNIGNTLSAYSNMLNPTKSSIDTTSKTLLHGLSVITDKEKTPLEKVIDIASTATSNVLNSTSAVNLYRNGTQVLGSIAPQGSGDKLLEIGETITEPYYEMQEQLDKEGEQYGEVTQMLGKALNSAGRMAPSVVASYLTKNPAVGLGIMGISAKGSATTEALRKGADLDKAVKIGDTKAMIEIGTEMLSGGVNIFGKGAIDDIVEKGINTKVKNKVINYLAKQGIGLSSEVVEETISDVLGTIIDKGTVDPNASYSLNDWNETAITTILSTFVLNGLTGGYSKKAYKANVQNMQEFNNSLNNGAKNQNNSTTQGILQEQQQFTPQETKTAQNGNIGQIDSDILNNNIELNQTNKTNFEIGLDKFKSKQYNQTDNINVLDELPNYFYNLGYETQQPLTLNLKKLENIMKEPKGNYNGVNQHGITMDIIEKIPEAISNPLNVIKNPKYNNRFVIITDLTDQYGDIVVVPVEINNTATIQGISKINSIYGKETYDTPNNDNLQSYMEQNKNNIVYDIDNERSSLNNYRLQLPSETKTTSNQSITSQNENVNYINNYAQQSENNTNNIKNTYNELSDMLNNKDLPMQYYQYEKSDNVKVNSLKESASKYFNNSEQTKNYISMLEQIVTDKNIEIRFEDNLKTPDGKIANGSYSDGVITINPNSSGTGEFIAVHELTHAIGTNEMVKMIENFKNSNVEFNTEMKALLDNYSSTEINEEALADVSAQLLGNQEFINNVAQNNSNIFKKIYSEIKYLWHQFRGYKNQNQFVEDLYYKWTKAYNSSNELNSTTNYSTETLEDGTTYVKAENNKFIKEDGTKMTPREAYQSLIGTTIQFSDGDSAKIVNRLPNKDMYNELSKRYPSKFKNVENIKEVNGSINDNIEELLTNTTIKEANVPDFKDRHQKQGIKNFDTRTVKFYDGNNAYDIDFSIAVLEDGSKVAYAKKYIEGNQNLTQKIKTVEARSEKSSLNQQSLSKDSITPSNNDVNTSTKYSIQESENNSGSFSLDKNAKRYEDLILADNIKYNKRADDNINVEICNNNELINQIVITSKSDAVHQLGENIADHIYGTANNNIKSLELSNETTVDVTDTSHKGKQLAIIKENNPMLDDYHVGIRSVEDIKTFDEVINDEESFVWGDFSKEDAENALKQGEITVYSSYPIKQGTFVSTSKIQAEQYAGGQNSKVYSKTIPLNEVAWINGDEGQCAKVSSEKYSTQTNSSWYDYLERTFPNKGTRTYAKDILVKKADNEGSYSTRNNKNNVANSLNTIYNNAKLGEVKQVPVETLLSIQNSTGGYRTQEQINNLKSDIRANGITTPIEIYKKSDGTFAIENGNHRLKIAQELGIKDVPVKLVKSWNDVGISKENVSETFEQEYGGIFNDGITERNSNIDEGRWNRARSRLNDNVQFEDSGRTGRNAELYERTSNSNEFTSSNENKGNNRQQEVDDSTSFNMSNNAPSSDKNSFGTSTGENSWSRQQAEKKKQRKHYESIIKSNYTTDEAKAIAKELMGTDTYVPESNSRQLEVADERIASAGADSELNSLISRATTGGNIKSDDIAVGERLIQYYSKTGDKFKLQEAIQATAMAGTTAGQTVQAMALLNHQTPEGQAIWLQRSVDKMNSDLRKTRGKNAEQFNLTAEMLEKVASSENAKALEENLNEVYKELGQQVTKTTAQKIDAWRYFSMLSSPKTHIRNITGNTAMAGVQGIKNKVAGTIEGVVGKFNSDMERTHTLKIASKEVKSFAKADIENVADRLGLNENKYNPKTRLENNMRTFKSDVMEKTVGKVFEINNNLLEAEDGWGLKAGYVKALSEYMTANNLTPDTITDKQLNKARNYAVEQAKEATFHQDSQLASLLNQLSNKNQFSKFILDSTLPFKKTPINVAKAGIEYSPVGLVKSAVYDTVKLRKGDITVNKYIDNISKGLTGTGIALVGYALADCGILKASGSDDEDRESFEEGRGSQNYSITIGDNTYSLDWLAPSGIPLFIGAECYELMQASSEKKTSSSDDDKIYNQVIESATNILDSFANAMNPMTEMSMLSGLTSALKSYDQGSSQMLASLGTNAVKSYVNQFFPTGLGQIAKTIDGYERSTISTKTGVLPKAIDTTKNQIMSKIPGLRELLPVKTDTWGEEMKQSDNVLVRALENSVLPWTRKELNSTDVDKEILSVYENTGESSVFPDSINKNITIDKQKYTMTSEEYAKYKQQYGQTSYNLLNSLIKSSGYKKLSDEQKQLAIEKIYSYSTEQIKVDYAKQNGLTYEQSTLSSVVNSIKRVDGNTSNYFEFLAKTQDLTKESEKVEILANSNYSNSTKTAIYENSLGKEDSSYKILKKSFTNDGLNMTKYLKYVSQEFTSDKEDDGTVSGKTISGSKKDKVVDYINSISGTTYTQRILLYGLKYKPESVSDRELIVNYICDNWTGSERTEMFEQFTWITQYKNGKIGI